MRDAWDWNRTAVGERFAPGPFTLLDETLRDGIQNPSVKDPSLDDKLRLLHLMDELGLDAVNLGLPASSPRNAEHVLALAHEIARSRLRIRACAAGRTVVSDLAPIVEVSQKTGVPIDVYTFIGSSPIRQLAESWDLDAIAKKSAAAIAFAAERGHAVTYVTEDTTRSRPEVLDVLFRSALEHGASGLCLADTVGHATPDGVRRLVEFTRAVIAKTGARGVRIDWHGHNDRGFALQNALWALTFGVDRVHGTALGVGERVGNVPMELLLVNLGLLGAIEPPARESLADYCATTSRALAFPVPANHPFADWVGAPPRRREDRGLSHAEG